MVDYAKKIAEKEARRTELFELRAPIDEELRKLHDELQGLRDKQEKELLKKEMTFDEKAEYFLFEDGRSGGMTKHRAAEKFFHDLGLWTSGYAPAISQKHLQVMLYKGEGDNLAQTISSICSLLPHMKAVDGAVRFGVFEHSLSENGSYEFLIEEDGACCLNVHRYHRKSLVSKFDTIEDGLAYIQQHHYYESSVDGENDDDDED